MTEFLKLLIARDAWNIFRASFAPTVRVETSPLSPTPAGLCAGAGRDGAARLA